MQTFAELLATADPGKRLQSWNGMRVYAVDPRHPDQPLIDAGGDVAHDPASLTKMMTFYLALEAIEAGKLRLDEKVTVSHAAAHVQDALVKEGKLPVTQLLDAMMTASANGAAVAMAARLGSDTIDRMNATAKKLGLHHTSFSNVNGLPVKEGRENSTTAQDMALLLRRIYDISPTLAARYMGQASVSYSGQKKHDANHFLKAAKDPAFMPRSYQVGAKTGFTNRAHHNIASMITAPDGRQLTIVVLGADRQSADVEREVGVPGNKHVKGNHLRDILVHRLALDLLDPRSAHRGVTMNVADEMAVKPAEGSAAHASNAPDHPSVHAAKAREVQAEIARALPSSAKKAVADCTQHLRAKHITLLPKPGPEADVHHAVPSVPAVIAHKEAELRSAVSQLGKKDLKPAERARLKHTIAALNNIIPAQLKFMGRMNVIENQTDNSIYSEANYNAQIKHGQTYTDAFVDSWNGALPPGGREALKRKFHAITEGSAGMETGWSPNTVWGAAVKGGTHTGVFQTEWNFIATSRQIIEHNAAMAAVLQKSPKDKQIFELTKDLKTAEGLPATSFAAQGASFAGMAAAAFEQFIQNGGKPEDFNGTVVYEYHLLGRAGAATFREALATHPNTKGHPGISEKAYHGNFLDTDNPYSPMDDLNRDRIVYRDVTAAEVAQMLHEKFIHAYNKRAKSGVSPEQLEAFQQAFLPEWANDEIKVRDIARVMQEKEIGFDRRTNADPKNPCEVLLPMPPANRQNGVALR